MNTIDLILGGILLFGGIRGFIKGFVYEIAMLGALVVFYFLGFQLAAIVAKYIFKSFGGNPEIIRVVSYLAVWIGISIAAWFLAKLFEGLIKITALGIFNKIAGAIFGIIKIGFLTGLLIYFFNKADSRFNWINQKTKAESYLYYPLLRCASVVIKKSPY